MWLSKAAYNLAECFVTFFMAVVLALHPNKQRQLLESLTKASPTMTQFRRTIHVPNIQTRESNHDKQLTMLPDGVVSRQPLKVTASLGVLAQHQSPAWMCSLLLPCDQTVPSSGWRRSQVLVAVKPRSQHKNKDKTTDNVKYGSWYYYLLTT